ncbi:hypothetical protein BaRGS_00008073 [Batillaria attramentaria]|uniref:Uncharacterized protein n=1 Tax=Batillaria attramentaria TaxID=370345 RepID=A0ABD0LP79_9CAEN
MNGHPPHPTTTTQPQASASFITDAKQAGRKLLATVTTLMGTLCLRRNDLQHQKRPPQCNGRQASAHKIVIKIDGLASEMTEASSTLLRKLYPGSVPQGG